MVVKCFICIVQLCALVLLLFTLLFLVFTTWSLHEKNRYLFCVTQCVFSFAVFENMLIFLLVSRKRPFVRIGSFNDSR